MPFAIRLLSRGSSPLGKFLTSTHVIVPTGPWWEGERGRLWGNTVEYIDMCYSVRKRTTRVRRFGGGEAMEYTDMHGVDVVTEKGGGLIVRDLILFTHRQQPTHVDNYSRHAPAATQREQRKRKQRNGNNGTETIGTETTARKQRHGNNGTGHQSGERGRVVW